MQRDQKPRSLLSAARIAVLGVVFGSVIPGGPLVGQDPAGEVPADQDPEIEAKLEQLEDAFTERRQTRDAEATRLVEELTTRLDQPIHPKDRQAIGSVFAKVLTTGRLRDPEHAGPYRAAIDGLARFGAEGAQVLIRVYEKKRFPRHTEWAPMREALVEGIGATGAPEAIPFLVERVQRGDEDAELRAAGAAMKRYATAPQQARKDMVEILARRLAGFEAEASAPAVNQDQHLNLNRENAARSLKVVAGPWKDTLHALTGETAESGVAWQRWFQDNKRRDWPERGGDGGGGGDARGGGESPPPTRR